MIFKPLSPAHGAAALLEGHNASIRPTPDLAIRLKRSDESYLHHVIGTILQADLATFELKCHLDSVPLQPHFLVKQQATCKGLLRLKNKHATCSV